MRAGDLNSSVTFWQPGTPVSDGQGGTTSTPSQVGPAVYASIATTLTPEQLAAMQVTPQLTHTVTVPYSSALSAARPTWSIVWGSRTLQIQSFQDLGDRHRELMFLCREVQA